MIVGKGKKTHVSNDKENTSGSIVKPKRKTRNDKKRDIKPTISIELKDSIYRLSTITTTPVKDICEKFILNGIYENTEIVKRLSKNFQRGIRIHQTFHNGSLANDRISKHETGETERISFRVKNELYTQLHALAYALDCSVSRVAAILLYESITDADFIEKYTESYIASLDESRRNELKILLSYIRVEKKEPMSMAALVSYLVDEPLKWFMPTD